MAMIRGTQQRLGIHHRRKRDASKTGLAAQTEPEREKRWTMGSTISERGLVTAGERERLEFGWGVQKLRAGSVGSNGERRMAPGRNAKGS